MTAWSTSNSETAACTPLLSLASGHAREGHDQVARAELDEPLRAS
jgi:hypothetical protein